MGHQRLGKLPAHRLLPEIVRYLVDGGEPAADLVQQITEFSRDALRHAVKDPGFIEALWLLVKLPQAAAEKKTSGSGNLPDLLVDLLEIASYVYCADQRAGRGSEKLSNYGENWRRSLHWSRMPR